MNTKLSIEQRIEVVADTIYTKQHMTKQTLYRYIVRDKKLDQGLAAAVIMDYDLDLECSLYEEAEKLPLPKEESFPDHAKFYFTSHGKNECEYLTKLWAFNVLLQKRDGLFSESMEIVLLTVEVDESIPRLYTDTFQQVVDEKQVCLITEQSLDLEEIWNELDDDQ